VADIVSVPLPFDFSFLSVPLVTLLHDVNFSWLNFNDRISNNHILPVIKRGGMHPIFDIFVEGLPLTPEYALSTSNGYSGTSQLRSKKSLNLAENSLYSQRNDTTTLKFNGKMGVKENTASLSELNLEGFLRAVGDTVECFGPDKFFYLPNSSGTMQYLPEDSHTFSLTSVLDEHTSRLVEPPPVMDNTGSETQASIIAWHKYYNIYELCNVSPSRLSIEALVHPELCAEIVVQFNHMPKFKRLPGSVYLMMVLDVCHASFAFKMDNAAKILTKLSFATFPGENVSKLSNETQRFIKIMKEGYALPYYLGSQIIQKVCSTPSMYFNRTMYNLLDRVLALKKGHGHHRDPKLLERDPNYKKCGPLGLCVAMRENCSDLVITDQWPALKHTIPSGNLGAVTKNPPPTLEKKDSNGMKFYNCESEYHLIAHCSEPRKDPSPGSNASKSGSTTKGSAWRYIFPDDKDTTIIMDGKNYHYCKHCVCKNTGTQGFYNRTHSSKYHTFPRGDTDINTVTTEFSTAASSMSTLGSASASPGCSLGVASSSVKPPPPTYKSPNPPPMPPVKEDPLDPDDPNGLEFVSVFIADASSDNAVWLTKVDDPSFFLQLLASP